MDNFIFCLNATLPIFIIMLLGMFFRKIGLFTESFTKTANSFVFKVALPCLLFEDIASEDIASAWNGKFIAFCAAATIISILLAIVISFAFKDRSIRGEFAQGAYRSSAALLGVGIITNVYGTSGMGPLMIVGSVPLYNICAVIILSLMKGEGGKLTKDKLMGSLKEIVTNPIIIGIVLGFIWSALRIPKPVIMEKSVKYMANLATPLGIMALGASFDIKKAFAMLKPSVLASFLKLIGFTAIFLPIAVKLGFRNDELLAILVMLGSPATVSCFVMSKSMGHDGTLSSGVVMLTTLFSAFTLTLWLYVLRCFALI